MRTVKRQLKEELNRMKYLAGLNEQQAAPQQQAQAGQAQNPDQIKKNIDTTLKQAMDVVIKNLGKSLASATKSIGDKDGVMDVPGVYTNDSNPQPGQAQSQNKQTVQEDDYMLEIIDDISENVIEEDVSEKTRKIIDSWMEKFGARETAVKIINNFLLRTVGMTASDLPDTSTFSNGLDVMEDDLNEGDYKEALKTATETAMEMLEDEGFGNLFEEESNELYEITFDEEKYKENCTLEEGGLLGVVASAPAILQFGGKAAGWLGEKLNQNWLKSAGNYVAKKGEQLHHFYIDEIEKTLHMFMPNADQEKIHKASEALFMGLVGILFAGSLAHPGALTAVKGGELGQYVMSNLPKVLDKLGFA